MDDELSKILSGDDTQPEVKTEVKTEEKTEDQELKAKQEQLSNLQNAIKESQDQLRKIREDKKVAKSGVPEEEDIPKINLDDPSAKAWDRHIGERVSPVQAELEKEKEEVRSYALKEFLEDKPALSKSSEKLRELMGMYDRIRTASERTREGVLTDLERAYAATFHEELLAAARGQRVQQAQAESVFSDIAVSRGSTAYSPNKESTEMQLTEDDKRSILSMGYASVSEWIADKKKYNG